ncbi:TIGR00269 family protein [Candidatus Micrarchaeota archaeon]|nr:TIGR00269 family protein [Candidatus Micrarchaeota archaeon]
MKTMVECIRCGKEAVVELRYCKEDLCQYCFKELFEKRVWKANKDFSLVTRGDRIVVGVSGGKDSSALLFVLHKMAKKIGDVEIIPVLVNEGIEGYRNKAIEKARELCEKLGYELNIVSYKETVGFSMDEVMKVRGPNGHKSCTYCGVFRKNGLNQAALDFKANKLAIGHNADDTSQTFLMNLLRNETHRITKFGSQTSEEEGLVKRIKPLIYCLEKECAWYCEAAELPYYLGECPYANESFRGESKEFLNELEEKYPGVKFNLLHSFLSIQEELKKNPVEEKPFLKCASCGNPCAGVKCKKCEFVEELTSKKNASKS